MKQITFFAAFLAVFSLNAQIFEEGFETFDDFAITNIGDWTLIDNDDITTFGSTVISFPNESYVGSAIIFNHTTATFDADGAPASSDAGFQVRTGEKGLWFFAATTAPNDDYAITPQISLDGAEATFSFWAKSFTDAFGLEEFEVLLSTTGTEIADFTENLSGGVITAPTDDGNLYTEFSYDLSEFANEDVYLAIHYVGNNSFILQMDDFSIDSNLSVEDNTIEGLTSLVANNTLTINANNPLENIIIHNLNGQEIISRKLTNTTETVDLSALSTGIYIATVQTEGKLTAIKLVK